MRVCGGRWLASQGSELLTRRFCTKLTAMYTIDRAHGQPPPLTLLALLHNSAACSTDRKILRMGSCCGISSDPEVRRLQTVPDLDKCKQHFFNICTTCPTRESTQAARDGLIARRSPGRCSFVLSVFLTFAKHFHVPRFMLSLLSSR